MVRLSKQEKRRSMNYKAPRLAGPKTGPKKNNLAKGFRPHENGVSGALAQSHFIGKIK